jgi:hypothetical protein
MAKYADFSALAPSAAGGDIMHARVWFFRPRARRVQGYLPVLLTSWVRYVAFTAQHHRKSLPTKTRAAIMANEYSRTWILGSPAPIAYWLS